MKSVFLACLLAAIPISVSGGNRGSHELVLCRGDDESTIVVELWKPSEYDVPLHCIRADFLIDTVSCAPNGGWGLNSTAAATEFTNDWKTAHNHQASKVTATAGKRGVRFNAQQGEGVGNNLSYEWKFTLERRTGKAAWSTKDGHKFLYVCEVQS